MNPDYKGSYEKPLTLGGYSYKEFVRYWCSKPRRRKKQRRKTS